jgi:hypothetical protein
MASGAKTARRRSSHSVRVVHHMKPRLPTDRSSSRKGTAKKRAERMWPDTEAEELGGPASSTSASQDDALPSGQLLSIALPVGRGSGMESGPAGDAARSHG